MCVCHLLSGSDISFPSFKPYHWLKQKATAHSWDYCQRSYSWAGWISRLITVTCLQTKVLFTILWHPWAEAVTKSIFRLFTRVQKILVADPLLCLLHAWLTLSCRQPHRYCIHRTRVCPPVGFLKPEHGTVPGVILARRGTVWTDLVRVGRCAFSTLFL